MRTRFLSCRVSERFGWLRVVGCSVSVSSTAAFFQPQGNDNAVHWRGLPGEEESVLPSTSLLLVLIF